ncbi:MAG TPA: hypothetical protein VNO70_25505, partial [Blastocatellia bacterium]|nr:hypothetical protein [Blastocatellia bacterium]
MGKRLRISGVILNYKQEDSLMIRKLLTASLTASVAFAVVFFASSATSNAQDVVILQGTIRKAKLNNKKRYLLQGVVFISKKLVIKAGAQIFGSQGSALVIQQGAKIKATGTQEEPIVMTSDQPVGDRRPGDWGGLVLNRRASINVPGGVGSGEGNTGNYGGGTSPDDNDSSGVLRFVRVEYGGFAISPENELNCIAFQGAGAGTEVDHIAAAWGGDDGIEFFGGTTNMKFAAIVGATDDSLDWTFGWRGKVQFLLVQQRAGEADNGIEADNNENNNN